MFIERICNNLESSRLKSESAQAREFVTNQPKEKLSTDTKAKITITNYLGGKYFFTVDEIILEEDTIRLIEAKHTKGSKIPSVSDIKDGLVKMMLYSNLEKVSVDGNLREAFPALLLTSHKLRGFIKSASVQEEIKEFFSKNSFNKRQIDLMSNLFMEANTQ